MPRPLTLTLVAGVGEIYQSNVNVQFTVSYLRVWETNSDAYNQGDDLLQEFRNHWNATQGGVERDLRTCCLVEVTCRTAAWPTSASFAARTSGMACRGTSTAPSHP